MNTDIANYQVQTASTSYEFGLRPRIGNVMLNVNAKLISDMASRTYVTANASLVLGLNFARRFKNYEYDQVHNAVLRMKNY